jgi:acetylglutamate kinase
LTGADAGVATVKRARVFTSTAGEQVSLGLVGSPINNGAPRLLATLLAEQYVPIVACIGATREGELMNVNADTLAAHLAVAIGARRLVIAGGTSGVLDHGGQTIARLTSAGAARLIKQGTANAGMIAKLQACRAAVRGGVADVLIVNGRTAAFGPLAERVTAGDVPGTQVVA